MDRQKHTEAHLVVHGSVHRRARDDHLLSTLRRYVEALGGHLEVIAVIGNKRVTLTGV